MSEMKRPANMSRIRSFFERWERLETQRRELSDDLKELFSEAKVEGFNSKALRAAFAEKFRVENEPSTKAEKRQMDEADADLYLAALAGPSHACETGSYAEHSMSMYLRKEDMPAAGELTEHEQPETAKEFHPPVTAREGHEGDPSPTLGEKDLVEVGTGHNCAVLPQEPYKAPITNPQPFPLSGADKPETVSPPAVSGALSDDDVPAFLKRDHAPKPAGDKPYCLKLKDGHCKIGFATSALCAECNAAKAKVSA